MSRLRLWPSRSHFCTDHLADLLLAGDPLRVNAETALITPEHLRGLLASLQLPVQPGKRGFVESAAIGAVCIVYFGKVRGIAYRPLFFFASSLRQEI